MADETRWGRGIITAGIIWKGSYDGWKMMGKGYYNGKGIMEGVLKRMKYDGERV
jgi:hypothetical protein